MKALPMKLLDLFCGAGGAAMGYRLAGFDVVGVDIEPQPHYPFEFIQADAITFPLDGFDVVHASPPCQRFSRGTPKANISKHPDLLTPTRRRLKRWGGVWVIENVMGAPMQPPTILLCGLMFGLKVFRHRLFETSHLLFAPEHPSHKDHKLGEGMYCVAGNGGMWRVWGAKEKGVVKGGKAEWSDAMGIHWMTRKELTQAIPPAYTEWIGGQLRCIGQQEGNEATSTSGAQATYSFRPTNVTWTGATDERRTD